MRNRPAWQRGGWYKSKEARLRQARSHQFHPSQTGKREEMVMNNDTPLVSPIGFDHVNLKTRDMARAINFYTDVLGLRLVRAESDAQGAVRFASLRIGDMLIDLQPGDGDWSAESTGLNHVAILVEPIDLDALASAFRGQGIEITQGPVRRQGAFGFGQALYIRDPDGHGIEIKHHEWPVIN
jgi:glyoxylase I family protein